MEPSLWGSCSTAAPPQVNEVKPVTLVEGLEHPWGMAWLPNGDLLITERPGRLRLVQGGRLNSTPLELLHQQILG